MAKYFAIALVSVLIHYAPIGADRTASSQTVAVDARGASASWTREDAIGAMKSSLLSEFEAHPNLYDPKDVEDFMNDRGLFSASHFLNQRAGNWNEAFTLVLTTLNWRASMQVNQLEAAHFPCDLFRLGLIFEYGKTHQQDSGSGEYIAGNPVIWIRLSALGSVVKHLEQATPKRVMSYAFNSARNALQKSRGLLSRLSASRREPKVERAPIVEDLSVKNDATIAHTLKAITWWLNDWVERQPTGQKATLVLDFEDTDFAFSSWSMGEYFVKLDDRFPDLFDQIIGFRFKPKLWSLHSPISMFNRIFKSRVASSVQTDAKLKFVKSEPQIGAYMPRVDVKGFTMLPEHVSGICVAENRVAPAGCQEDSNFLAQSGLFNQQLWQDIHNEFYHLCKPKPREHL